MKLPQHVAIIMDGNGRWASKRLLPRVAGHQQGAESVRAIVAASAKKGIKALTLFAFSSENWHRPKPEVDFLLSFLLRSLKNEIAELHKNNICLKVFGDKAAFSAEMQTSIEAAEAKTAQNSGLKLNIALNYGGRWDIVQATRLLSERVAKGELLAQDISEEMFQQTLSLSDCAEPDLLIRTSGEERLSNFLLWQLAYTELYFTDTLWPDFREPEFDKALEAYANRVRRFGQSPEQLEAKTPSADANPEHHAHA
jgi:undecaprenyl diphosphate synthase